jgi:hypothetical protein
LIEKPDDALLTDNEVFMLKGGNAGLIAKSIVGLGAVFLYLAATKRINEIWRYEIRGSTILMSNAVFLSTCGLYQYVYCMSVNGTYSRLKLHRAALYQRFMLNYSFMLENKKKPKIH